MNEHVWLDGSWSLQVMYPQTRIVGYLDGYYLIVFALSSKCS